MKLGTKDDLLQCLEDLVPHNHNACSQREAHTVTIDGVALVTIFKNATFEMFDDYVHGTHQETVCRFCLSW